MSFSQHTQPDSPVNMRHTARMVRTLGARVTLVLLMSVSATCAAQPARTEPAGHEREDPTLAAILKLKGQRAAVALLVDGQAQVRCAGVAACRERVTPGQTFEIASALIGLETGAISSADAVIDWDGVKRDAPEWNRDQTLRTALRSSATPFFEELTRRAGKQHIDEWLHKLGYGNMQSGAAELDFWREGPLAITPIEQLQFLRRFATRTLPITERSSSTVRELLVTAWRGHSALRGKMGWGLTTSRDEVAWFVGYAERGAHRAYIAVQVFLPLNQEIDRTIARDIATRALKETGF